MARRCAACGAPNRAESKYCRSCGTAHAVTDAALATDASSNLVSHADAIPESISSGPDSQAAIAMAQRTFRELATVCGSLIVLSAVCTVAVRLDGDRPIYDLIATSAVGVAALLFSARHWSVVRPALKLPPAKSWLYVVATALIAAPLLEACFALLKRLGFALYHGYLTSYLLEGWPVWIGFATIAFATPIFEELVFRGVVYAELERVVRPREALVVQAALFSALHMSPLILVTHFIMGLVFGGLRRKTGSLYPGMLLHAAWNAWVLWAEL